MSDLIQTTGVSHVRLIVTDVARSREFYTSLLNFQFALDEPPGRGVILSNGNTLLGLTVAWDKSQAIPNDKFSFNRVGLDHLSFGVSSRAELESAAAIFKERGEIHGEIKDLTGFGMSILSFENPDGIQLELFAPTK